MNIVTKDQQITVIAILKSVIESGANPRDWEKLVKTGLNVYSKIGKDINKKENS